MAVYFAPERKTGLGEFAEGMKPGLQQAFQFYLQNKMQEMQRQKQMEQMSQTFPEAFTPNYEGAVREKYPVKLFEGYQPTPEQWQEVYQKKTGRLTVPSQFMKFNPAALPEGIKINMPPFIYEKPQPNLFQNVTIDAEGNPAIKIGEQVIPLKSLSKTGATFDTGEKNEFEQLKNELKSSPLEEKIPNYDPKTQKLMYSPSQKKYYVIKK